MIKKMLFEKEGTCGYCNRETFLRYKVKMKTKEFNMCTKNVTEFNNILRANGWIKIIPLPIPGKPKPQNVYVFGNWRMVDGKIEEEYFASKF